MRALLAQGSGRLVPNNTPRGTYQDGFTLKLGGFGKFSVRHKPGIRRKVGFSGETIQTKMLRKVKFISLGALRQQERVDCGKEKPC